MEYNQDGTNLLRAEFIDDQEALFQTLKKWNRIRTRKLNIPFLVLELKYKSICKQLNQAKPNSIEKTSSEIQLARMIKRECKLTFNRSVWIGPFNFDFLFIQLGETGGTSVKGYVIEVDGPVHDRQVKMSKDQLRYSLLHALKIGLISVPNDGLRDSSFRRIIENLKSIRRLDNRQRKRILRNLYLFTIICNLTDSQLNQFLEQNSRKIVRKGPCHGL